MSRSEGVQDFSQRQWQRLEYEDPAIVRNSHRQEGEGGILEEFGKAAQSIQAVAPWSAGAWDYLLGPLGNDKNAQNWQGFRPRPHRGPTANPAIPGKVRQEKEAQERKERREEAAAEEEAEKERRAAEQKKLDEEMMEKEMAQQDLTQSRRMGYFGRPGEQFRLNKKQIWMTMLEWQQQAAMMRHLEHDSKTEEDIQNKNMKQAAKDKNEAAKQAADLRGKEQGARAAAMGLNGIGGTQLAKDVKKAQRTAEQYRQQAEAQERTAREKRWEQEVAEKKMQKEAEKARACKAQVKGCQNKCYGLLDQVFQQEQKEMNALNVEYGIVEGFIKDWSKKLGRAPKGSSARTQIQGRINELLAKQAVIAKERRMFVPLQVDFKGNKEAYRAALTKADPEAWQRYENLGDATGLLAQKENGGFLVRPKQREFKWEVQRQTRGMMVLGKGVLGPMTLRKKVVLVEGKEEEEDKPDLKLPGESCAELTKSILVDPRKLLGPPYKFQSIEEAKEGEEGQTLLTEEVLRRLWGEGWDGRADVHKVRDGIAGTISITPRHRVEFRWLAAWVDPLDQHSGFYRKGGPFEVPREKGGPVQSFILGPQKLRTVKVAVAESELKDALGERELEERRQAAEKVHEPFDKEKVKREIEQQPRELKGKDGKPVYTAAIRCWHKQPGEKVAAGEPLLDIAVLKAGESPGPAKPGATRTIVAPAEGTLTGLCPFAKELSKSATGKDQPAAILLQTGQEEPEKCWYAVSASDEVAEIDVGEDQWQTQVLPVDEWHLVY